jgi:hypothetical protein
MGYVLKAIITKVILKIRHRTKCNLLYLSVLMLKATYNMARLASINVKLRNKVIVNIRLMVNIISTAINHLGYILN